MSEKIEKHPINSLENALRNLSLEIIRRAHKNIDIIKLERAIISLDKKPTKVCNSCHKESDTGHQIFICEDCGVKPEIVITDKI